MTLQRESGCMSRQREINRWSQFSEQKLNSFSKVKILINAYGHIGFIKDIGVAVIIYY